MSGIFISSLLGTKAPNSNCLQTGGTVFFFLHRASNAQWFSSGAGLGPREGKSATSSTIRVLRSNVRIIEKVKQGQNMPRLANGESLSHRIEHLRGRDTEHISI